MGQTMDRADQLEAEISRHNALYFEQAAPVISDDAFDRLVEELKTLRPGSPILAEIGGAGAAVEADKVWVHTVPMLSLDKCYDEPTLTRWADKFTGRAMQTPKIDGVAAAFVYGDDGRLKVVATRGSGSHGEICTPNMRHVAGVPEVAQPGLEVRGEVYMPLSVFHERFASRGFANPRNTAAGAIKQKDAAKTAEYGLKFFAYDVLNADPPPETEEAKMQLLSKLGSSPPEGWRILDKEEMQAAYEAWERRRDDLDFEIDGVVFKVDDLSQQRGMGVTAHHPRWAIAYKVKTESRVAKLVQVLWSVSRTGAVTPVANIEPTSLSGVTVTRISLHNLGMVRKLGILADSTLRVTRRGGVIPYVEEVVAASGVPVEPPALCPECDTPTVEDGDHLKCPNLDCRSRRIGVLEHYAKVIDVDGFGPAVLEQAYDRGILKDIDDFYTLSAQDLVPLERMGDKSARNLVAGVAARRRQPLRTFLVSIAIPEVGPTVAAVLERRFLSLDAVMAASEEDLAGVDGIGPIIAAHVAAAWQAREDRLARLLSHVTVVPFEPPPEADDADAGPFAGQSFVFTGKLTRGDRKSAQASVRALGGDTPSGVTKDLTFLVVGDEGSPLFGGGRKGSKIKKAEKLQESGAAVQVISETAFDDLVRVARATKA